MEKCAISAIDYQFEYISALSRYCRHLFKRRDILREMAEPKDGERTASESEAAVIMAGSSDLEAVQDMIDVARKEIQDIAAAAEGAGLPIGLEVMAKAHNLSELEWGVLALLCLQDVPPFNRKNHNVGTEILECLLGNAEKVVFSRSVFYRNSTLIRERLIDCGGYGDSILSAHYKLAEKTWRKMVGEQSVNAAEEDECEDSEESRHRTRTPARNDLVETRIAALTLNDVVLPASILSELTCWLHQVRNSGIEDRWGIDTKLLKGKSNALLLYGPPGTGKTLTAEAIAGELGRPLLVARYDQLMDMWYGNTEKNIVGTFKESRSRNAVLLFDECDGMFSRRTNEKHHLNANFENRHKSILLQEIENYQGIVILTSNFAEVIDEAFERRISLRLELPMPGIEERERIWRSFFSDKTPLTGDVDFRMLAERFAFSGGYIKNTVQRVLRRCMAENIEVITQNLLENAAMAEQNSMWTQSTSRAIGFGDGKIPA